MTDNRIIFVNGHYGRQPGWYRVDVFYDGRLIGYLNRHETRVGIEWLIADPKWNSVGERIYDDRQSAVEALVRNAEADRNA